MPAISHTAVCAPTRSRTRDPISRKLFHPATYSCKRDPLREDILARASERSTAKPRSPGVPPETRSARKTRSAPEERSECYAQSSPTSRSKQQNHPTDQDRTPPSNHRPKVAAWWSTSRQYNPPMHI